MSANLPLQPLGAGDLGQQFQPVRPCARRLSERQEIAEGLLAGLRPREIPRRIEVRQIAFSAHRGSSLYSHGRALQHLQHLGGDLAAIVGATIQTMMRSRPAPNLVELPPTIPEVVGRLQDVLGSRLTALIVGLADAGLLNDWVRGESHPDADIERRLRDAYGICQLLLHEESPQAVRGWFLGMNPELDDRAPAMVLADEPELVAEAARIFVATG